MDLVKMRSPRQRTEHSVLSWSEDLKMGTALTFDDTVSFNTQASTQWDSLLQYRQRSYAYNGRLA